MTTRKELLNFVSENKIPDDKYSDAYFNEPWMDNVNPRLLFRYWKKTGSDKPLITVEYGVEMIHVNHGSFGIVSSTVIPEFKPPEINTKIRKPFDKDRENWGR